MKIVRFEIRNFKGIDNTTIELNDVVPGSIITLIGLNESGKTTILEALSHFFTEDLDTASLVGTVHQKSSLQDIIPKDKKAAFTGAISIKAIVRFSESDISELASHAWARHELILDRAAMRREFVVERRYRFEDSAHKESGTYWTISFPLKTSRAKKFTEYTHVGSTRQTWISMIEYPKNRIAKIVYFPTFLFDFPDRIYLEGSDLPKTNDYYRQVLQDVLDSQGDKLSIDKHVLNRIQNVRNEFPTPLTFISHFLGLDEKSQIDAVMQRISNEMSRVIFGAWGEILGRNITNKRVQVDWFIDGERDNAPYIQVSIVDGQSKYALSERSLGFRWFFSFLLFTQFRRNRSGNNSTVFLFDEPAANLHSRAQIKLLESFEKIVNDETTIVYSTHSHYMINPLWLEKAYIVDNSAVDYDDDEQVDSFAIRKTDVKAIKYREFVGNNPSKTTYFQPVLDALDVSPTSLEMAARAFIMEGKQDFYALSYFKRRLGIADHINIYPASGAGEIGNLINLLNGWGVDFAILLDDDQGGREARKRYQKDFLVRDNRLFTLADPLPDLGGKAMEGIYKEDVLAKVGEMFSVKLVKKQHIGLFFQQLLSDKTALNLEKTEPEARRLLTWMETVFPSDAVPSGKPNRRRPKRPA